MLEVMLKTSEKLTGFLYHVSYFLPIDVIKKGAVVGVRDKILFLCRLSVELNMIRVLRFLTS